MDVYAGELKRVEDALADVRERLAVILRLVDSGIIATDTEGRVREISSIAERLTGWNSEEATGRYLNDILHIVDERTRVPCEDPVKRVLRVGGMEAPVNHKILISRDGAEHIVTDSGAPVYDEYSNAVGVVLAFRDVTEERQMEDELLEAQKLDSIGTVAGGIAHDFNNILTGIMGNISLAKLHTDPQSKAHERLMEAEKASMRAKDLTRQLLTFSKGGVPVVKATSITELLRSSISFVLSGSNVKCKFSIPDDLWPVEVDAGQVSQVISNVVINADQAMPEGGTIQVSAENVSLETEASIQAFTKSLSKKDVALCFANPDSPIQNKERKSIPLKSGKYVKISIQDDGVGIPEQHLHRIFEPYFTTKQEGNGLGLAISHFIVRSHNGYVAVDSQPGVGATFSIYLPASQRAIPVETEVEERLFMGKGRILVMDDDELVRDIVREMLSNIGYQVTVARDGGETIELYAKAEESRRRFDAVIVDLTVPGGIGGMEVLGKLVEIDPEVRSLVSSGYSNDPIMTNFREYGFSGAITKPYKVKELSEILHRVLGEANDPDAEL